MTHIFGGGDLSPPPCFGQWNQISGGSGLRRRVNERWMKRKCYTHHADRAVVRCTVCRRHLCRRCALLFSGIAYCPDHAEELNTFRRAADKPPAAFAPVSRLEQPRAWLLAVCFGWSGLHRFYLKRYYTGGIMAALWLISFLSGLAYFGWDWAHPDLATFAQYGKYAILVFIGGAGVELFFASGGYKILRFMETRPYVRQNLPESIGFDEAEIAMLAFVAMGMVIATGANIKQGDGLSGLSLAWFIGLTAMDGILWANDIIRLQGREMTDGDGLLVI